MEAWKSSGANLSAFVSDSNDDGLATSVPNGPGLHQSGFPRFFDIKYLQLEGGHQPYMFSGGALRFFSLWRTVDSIAIAHCALSKTKSGQKNS
jgi:hypothetical protein